MKKERNFPTVTATKKAKHGLTADTLGYTMRRLSLRRRNMKTEALWTPLPKKANI